MSTGSTRTQNFGFFTLYILLAQDVLCVKPKVVRDKYRLDAGHGPLRVRARALRAAACGRSLTALPVFKITLVARLGRCRMQVRTKICRKCGFPSPLTDFNDSKSPRSLDGKNNICATCRANYRDSRFQVNNKNHYKFKPPTSATSIKSLSTIPRTPAGDIEFLHALEEATELDYNTVSWINNEIPYRTCYIEATRIMLSIYSQKILQKQS